MSDHPSGPAPREQPPASASGASPVEPDPALGADALDWDALARMVAGEPPVADDAADEAARTWMAAHPAEAARLAAVNALASAHFAPIEGDAPLVDVESALARVKLHLAPSAPPVPAPPRPAVTSPPHHVRPATPAPRPVRKPAWAARTRWITAGAALAAAALAAVMLTRGGRPTAQPTPPIQFATATGQRTTVRLPDGTRVVLGPSSTLAAVRTYGVGERTVTLQGEAYFDVVHDAAHPFVVYAGPAVVRDIGTTFVVRAGTATDRAVVAVTQGAVQLAPVDPAQPPARVPRPTAADTAGAVLLRAGDRGLVDRSANARVGAVLRARKLAPAGAATGTADDLAWTTGRLVFRDASLPEVADALHRWYGFTLRVADPALASRTLTASFHGEPPAEVLRVITLALGARADQHGDTVFVRSAR